MAYLTVPVSVWLHFILPCELEYADGVFDTNIIVERCLCMYIADIGVGGAVWRACIRLGIRWYDIVFSGR